jgi:hypothetical protein
LIIIDEVALDVAMLGQMIRFTKLVSVAEAECRQGRKTEDAELFSVLLKNGLHASASPRVNPVSKARAGAFPLTVIRLRAARCDAPMPPR